MFRTIAITLLACLVFGLVRMPVENSVMKEEYQARLLPLPLPDSSQKELGQQLAMATLGGLRSLVASFLAIDAFSYFQNGEWPMLEKRYRLITSLAPHMPFYWKAAANYLGYDAASSIEENKSLPSEERYLGYKSYIDKAKDFLRRGIEANPANWSLYTEQGRLLAQPYRLPDYGASAAAYQKAVELGAPPLYKRMEFYSLARTSGKTREAWQLGRELYKDKQNRVPSLEVTLFALENRLKLPQDQRIPFDQLFPDRKRAKEDIYNQMTNGLKYPIDGLRETYDSLPD